MTRLPFRAGAVVVAIVALALTSSSASALPVNYNESTGGDLPQFAPMTLFTLDTGVNTIAGRFNNDGVAPLDFDSIAFTVPAGLNLTGGTLALADVSGNPHGGIWTLREGTTFQQGTSLKVFIIPSPGSDTVPALGAGTYNFSHSGIDGEGTTDFTLSLTVVPEPASLALLALAGGLTFRRRR